MTKQVARYEGAVVFSVKRQKIISCSFCGRDQDPLAQLVAAAVRLDVYICTDCIREAQRFLDADGGAH